jgi:hypothetical protein
VTAPGRNEPCPCGSGKKYKQCCLVKDEAKARAARAKAAKAAEAAPPPETTAEAPKERARKRHDTHQPWKAGAQNTRGFNRGVSAPRKVGGGG